jgi:hypothetical protein
MDKFGQPLPPIPVLEPFVQGFRLTFAHARLFCVLSFFPFLVTLGTLVALRVMDGNLADFWLPVLQLPSSFVTGLQGALILRFVVLHEYPLVPEGEAKNARNRAVTRAAIVYAAVSYFVTGAYTGLLKMRAFLVADPESAAPYAPLGLALMILVLWAVRWFWLHIPVALEWPARGFYARVGGWSGSLRIFALFALCSLVINFLAGFLRMGIMALAAAQPLSGFAAAFDDAVVAAATLLLAVLFTAASAAAVKMMAGVKIKDIEA